MTFDNDKLSGNLPAVLGLLTSLQTQNISFNYFTNGIPNEILQLRPSLYLQDTLYNQSFPTRPYTGITLNVFNVAAFLMYGFYWHMKKSQHRVSKVVNLE